jgi:hypothetical protein
LLLEGQRTNLATYSEEIDNAAWTKTRSTITANTSVSPDGTVDAERITDTTFTANSSFVERQITSVIGTAYTFSSFLKAGTAPFMYIGIYDGTNFNAIINAATGVISFTTAGATSTVTAYGNGWYRVSITRTITASTSVYPYIGVCQLSNSIIYNGTGAYTAQIWGVQYEAGAYATSYIPTTAATVTRLQETCLKSGIASTLPSQTGTLFAEFNFQMTRDGVQVISVHNNSNGLCWIQKSNSTTLQGSYFSSGFIGAVNLNVGSNASLIKVAYAWTNGSQALYVNGVQAGTASAAITDTNVFSILELNGFWNIPKEGTALAQALVFKTRLTNAQLAELTAL